MNTGTLAVERSLASVVAAGDAWEYDPSCARVTHLDSGRRTMLVMRFDIRRTRALTVGEALIRDLIPSSFRPAIHTELFAFAEVLSPPRREYLIATGSFRKCRHGRMTACYSFRGSGSVLTTLFSPGPAWGSQNLFLFVANDVSTG
ncbi:MAG: hypothetical protein ABIK13_00310 [Patescibacteria group bacterium]